VKTVAAGAPAKPAAARRKSVKTAAAPASVALVRQTRIARSETYCAERIEAAQRYLLSDGRRVTQCAAAAAVPAAG
jgi:hypothetical protein